MYSLATGNVMSTNEMPEAGQHSIDLAASKLAMREARRLAKPFGIAVEFVREEIWVYPPDYIPADPYQDHHFTSWEAALEAVKQYAKIFEGMKE